MTTSIISVQPYVLISLILVDILRIQGGNPLHGTVAISGSKNASLASFAATLLCDQPCVIENVPDLSDIRFMAKILSHLGAKVQKIQANTYQITAETIQAKAPYDLVRRMRASICLLGPLTGRLQHCSVSLPGGCTIGPRPIDLHLEGLSKLGCTVTIEGGYVHVDSGNLRGGTVFLGGRHGSTVTGTANILMAAILAPGVTHIESAASEPEIIDLCHMLQAMGADIEGIGSHHLKVTGVKQLHGCRHRIIPDRIEAGTFIIASLITRGDVTLQNIQPDHLHALFDKLEEAGIKLETIAEHSIRIRGDTQILQPVDLITLPHPGFPTDLQAPMGTLMSLTPGLSIITERVYPNRYMHVPELQRMGANIAIEGPSAIINGRKTLCGAPVMASDLRCAAALVLAGLAAQGETIVQRIYHLDRGYDRMEKKLTGLGATIQRVSDTHRSGNERCQKAIPTSPLLR